MMHDDHRRVARSPFSIVVLKADCSTWFDVKPTLCAALAEGRIACCFHRFERVTLSLSWNNVAELTRPLTRQWCWLGHRPEQSMILWFEDHRLSLDYTPIWFLKISKVSRLKPDVLPSVRRCLWCEIPYMDVGVFVNFPQSFNCFIFLLCEIGKVQ